MTTLIFRTIGVRAYISHKRHKRHKSFCAEPNRVCFKASGRFCWCSFVLFVAEVLCLLWLINESPATAVELCTFFDHQRGRNDLSLDVRSAAEHDLFGGANVALDSPINLRDSDLDHGFCDLRPCADDERSVLRGHVSGEIAVDTQHRFETDFTRKIYDVAHEAEPIVFIDISPLTINRCCHCVASGVSGRKES